jgi:hypothetical protein
MIVLLCSNDKHGVKRGESVEHVGHDPGDVVDELLHISHPPWKPPDLQYEPCAVVGDMIDGSTALRFCVLVLRSSIKKLGRALLKHRPEVIEPADGQPPALPVQIDIDMRTRHHFNQLA